VRVLLVAPHSLREPRGNSVTLARLAAGLRTAGARVKLLGPDQGEPQPRFNLVHAFHATKAGPRALGLARQTGAPLVVTMTGTDLNHDLQNSSRGRIVRRILARASALVVFNRATRARLGRHSKTWAAKTSVIPAAVAPPFFACGVARQG